jgi:hypothetical protein
VYSATTLSLLPSRRSKAGPTFNLLPSPPPTFLSHGRLQQKLWRSWSWLWLLSHVSCLMSLSDPPPPAFTAVF